ncbi:MAG: cytosine deaminase [Opitutaceae bacterium]
MHLFRRARIPLACLPPTLQAPPDGSDPRLEPWAECDVTVSDEEIVSVVPSHRTPATAASSASLSTTDLQGVLVFPGLIDVHTHLDKAHTWHRAPNPTGEFWDAIQALGNDSKRWTEADILHRAGFALRSAYAHGTVALRTHIDTGAGAVGEPGHAAMQRLRQEWKGRIHLQTVSLCNLAAFANGESRRIVELTARYGATALGGFPQPNPDLPRQYDALMAAARELGVGLDLHVDESGLAHAECLRAAAEAVLRNRFPNPVACGHNCSLAIQDPARAASTIDLVREAGIHIISLPLCNLYLQGRSRAPAAAGSLSAGPAQTPRWRGVTLLHEFMEAGVTVASGSDNVRDAFYAWGDLDAMEVYHQSVRIAHLDTRLDASPAVVTTGPARIMGLLSRGYGTVAPGAPADLIVFPARTFNELLARPAADRRLIHGEAFRPRQIPDYAELGSA